MSYVETMVADRLGGASFYHSNEIFKFEKIKRAKRAATKEHPELPLIDLGVGEPDEIADPTIISILAKEALEASNRGYADNGIDEFKMAAVEYMNTVYGVSDLTPETDILHVIGSKSAFAMIPQAFINPGDIALVTVPGYPILGTMTKWLGGSVYPLPLTQETQFLPDLDSIPDDILQRAKLLYINYPNNPTGAIANRKFFEDVVAFAKQHHIIVIHDAAYASLTFHGLKPLSFLSIPGAKEVGIEVQSLSKAFNMTGWRLGFIAGNSQIVSAIAAVKDNNDSGQFRAIQKAGIYALSHPEITKEYNIKYARRHQKLCQVLRSVGFDVKEPDGSFYLYARIPKGIEHGMIFDSAEDFSQYLIRKHLISTVPWDDAGHFVRFSVTFVAHSIHEEDQILQEIHSRLSSCQFYFE